MQSLLPCTTHTHLPLMPPPHTPPAMHAPCHTHPLPTMCTHLPAMHAPPCHAHPCHAHPPPWTEFLTHACENITFAQLLLRMVINWNDLCFWGGVGWVVTVGKKMSFMTHILNVRIVKNLSLVVLHYTFTMYWPRVYSISRWRKWDGCTSWSIYTTASC